MRRGPSIDQLAEGVLGGDRALLARSITLLESSRPDDQRAAQELLERLLGHTGNSIRLGFTGVPGVGKSTFLDQFGINLIAAGRRPAVLAVDPSSSRTGGSILGDKTRMERLSVAPEAFIRPSPAGRTLGGVNRVTSESMLLCEAAGFDTVLVETVGVGQSETEVADMVDCFVVLMLPGAGDDLQGIKKGILELADIIAVNKADGAGAAGARLAAGEYRHALHLLAPASPSWSPPVLTCSGLADIGLDVLWETVLDHHERMTASGEFDRRRRNQQRQWLWSMVEARLRAELHRQADAGGVVAQLEADVMDGVVPVGRAVDEIWNRFVHSLGPPDTGSVREAVPGPG